IKAPTVVLANLVLGENAFPEFHQETVTPENLAGTLLPLLSDTEARRRQQAALDRIPGLLQTDGGRAPSEAAADVVLDYGLGKGRRGGPT
ncbi:MAG TPA: lipid-A-disaccharide synthase, partial [Hyphomicrobium sp.]|nr:lipid-A-disaccharide synthase [Hyphomicrobium sp.]